MRTTLLSLLLSSLIPACIGGTFADSHRVLGPQAVNLWKLEQAARRAHSQLSFAQDGATQETFSTASPEFPEHWFTQPLDHFAKSSPTFGQRYWIYTRHYKPGTHAPVIVLDGGETSGEDRLPFMETGIVDVLTEATGGVGVVLEHRYYGTSVAVANLTTDSLRWLNNEQSAADSAHFMANVKFPGIDEDLTAPGTPWIYYGGSYAGARAAHMRILYPDLVYGAIASSAVTHADIENWEYMEIIRRAADPECSSALEHSIEVIDRILAVPYLDATLKGLFGLEQLEHNEDFASVLESPLSFWQAKNWNPAVSSTGFEDFCAVLTKPLAGSDLDDDELSYDEENNLITLPGGLDVPVTVYNYANYIKENVVSRCPDDATIEECFGTYNDAQYQKTTLDEEWRLWVFQYCTQWGYFFNAPPEGHPRIVSRFQTLEYASKLCHQAFLPGEHFIVPLFPNISAVNALGDFEIATDRLALIDGEVDPWRPDTPHSEHAPYREDTLLRPFKLIPGGVHHWDENGLRVHSDEPAEIQKIHKEEVEFVLSWLKDWKAPKL